MQFFLVIAQFIAVMAQFVEATPADTIAVIKLDFDPPAYARFEGPLKGTNWPNPCS